MTSIDRASFIIRPETSADYDEINKVNNLAFGREQEGVLVNKLRMRDDFNEELSLVAESKGKVVGHILYCPVKIEDEKGHFHPSLSLAPMAVLPEFQKQGIGGMLIREGLEKASDLGFNSVVVIGHPEYYPKFGFQKASKYGISEPYGAPDEAFMAIELEEGSLLRVSGKVIFPKEYDEAV